MRYLVLVIVSSLICHAICLSRQQIDGIYEYKIGDYSIRIILNDDSSYVIKERSILIHRKTDTLSRGTWRLDGQLLYLSSTYYHHRISNTAFIEMTVREAEENSADSIYFYISNEVEKWSEKPDIHTTRPSLLKGLIQYAVYFDGIYDVIILNGPEDIIGKVSTERIPGFRLSIVPNPLKFPNRIELSSIFTKDYHIKNPSSNSFYINLDKITFEFISQIRFKDEIVRIRDRTLEWSGMEFIKVDY